MENMEGVYNSARHLTFGNILHRSLLVYTFAGECVYRGQIKDVIIKVTPRYPLRDGEEWTATQNERNILQTFRESFVPEFYFEFTDEHFSYLVLERIEGCTLREHFEKYHDNEGVEFQRLWSVITNHLHTLHEKLHYVHHNLSPDNILVAMDGRIVLIDFENSQPALNTEYHHAASPPDPMYTPVGLMMGHVPKYKDDYESLMYILCEFYEGTLPWAKKATSKKTLGQKLGFSFAISEIK